MDAYNGTAEKSVLLKLSAYGERVVGGRAVVVEPRFASGTHRRQQSNWAFFVCVLLVSCLLLLQ